MSHPEPSLVSMPGVTVLREHPLPMTEAEAKERQKAGRMFPDPAEDIIHPDTFRERYLTVLSENQDWRIFRLDGYGDGDYVYIWNHMAGYGFQVDNSEGEFDLLAEAVGAAINTRQ